MNVKVAIFITMLALMAAVSNLNADPYRETNHSATVDVTLKIAENAAYVHGTVDNQPENGI